MGSLPVAQSSPAMGFSRPHLCPEWGTGADSIAGVQAEGPRGLGVGNALAELRAPGESRKTAGQAISTEHNALAEISTQTQLEKLLLLPFPTANSSLPAALPRGRSAPAQGPLA